DWRNNPALAATAAGWTRRVLRPKGSAVAEQQAFWGDPLEGLFRFWATPRQRSTVRSGRRTASRRRIVKSEMSAVWCNGKHPSLQSSRVRVRILALSPRWTPTRREWGL